MKGFKVVQCIEIDSYALFMAAVFPKDQKKLSLIMKKTCLKVFGLNINYLAKHRTISTITTFVCVRGFEWKLQVAYRVHLLNAWYIVIFMADN